MQVSLGRPLITDNAKAIGMMVDATVQVYLWISQRLCRSVTFCALYSVNSDGVCKLNVIWPRLIPSIPTMNPPDAAANSSQRKVEWCHFLAALKRRKEEAIRKTKLGHLTILSPAMCVNMTWIQVLRQAGKCDIRRLTKMLWSAKDSSCVDSLSQEEILSKSSLVSHCLQS